MTKLKDFTKNLSITKSRKFDLLKPEVSIILPILSSDDDNQITTTIKSLLKQYFKNFELIIVDDCNNKPSKLIKEFYDSDPRISIINHTYPVNIPAVLYNSAFLKSQGQKIFFISVNNSFTKNGLNNLVNYQNKNPEILACYGQIKIFHSNTDGTLDLNLSKLYELNHIPNSSILINRSILEDVGLYDPHIALLEHFQWDLYIRISKKYEIKKINNIISQRFSFHDKSSNNISVFYEWIFRHRDKSLLPRNIENYEIDKLPNNLSFYSKIILSGIIYNNFKSILNTPTISFNEESGYILVVGKFTDPSIELTFSAIKEQKIYVNHKIFAQNISELISGAKCVVFSRIIRNNIISLGEILKSIRVKYYYHLDDNFFIFSQTKKYYNRKSVLSFIKKAEGVIASSKNLKEDFQSRQLNGNIFNLDCSIPLEIEKDFIVDDSHFKEIENNQTIRIGYISLSKSKGFLELKEFIKDLVIKTNKNIEIVCFVEKEKNKFKKTFGGELGIKLKFLEKESSYIKFLYKLKREKIHFVIHTKGEAKDLNIYKYKTLNYFITASFANAIPLIINKPPFDQIKDNSELSKFIIYSNQSLSQRIVEIINNPPIIIYLNIVKNFIYNNFNSKINQNKLLKIISKHRNQRAIIDPDDIIKLQTSLEKNDYKYLKKSFTNALSKTIKHYYQKFIS